MEMISRMLKLPLWTALVILAALLACGEQTPAPGGVVATVPTLGEAVTPVPIQITSVPEATETPGSISTATQRPSAAATALPAKTLVPETTSEPTTTPSTPASTPTTTPGITPAGETANPTPSPTQVTSTATSTPTPEPEATLTITVAPILADIPEYDRDDWKHWVDEDGDCQDARQEVLVEESLVSVTFETDRQCRVETGRWFGAFTSVYVEDPSDLDIDHLVPLKNAHLSGAWRWDADMRQEYANYLEEEDHLIAVTAGANRSKGAKGPEEWGPPDLDYWCQYATDWTEVKARWGLTMTKVESEIVMDMLGTCENPPDMEVEELDYLGTLVGEHKPTPELQNSVYGSCEEAEAAGEERVQGSQGSGRGFPKEMVLSARDGDGDGVVCEK